MKVFISVIFIIVLTASCAENKDYANRIAIIELASIRTDLELYQTLNSLNFNNVIIYKKIEFSILRHIILVSSSEPDIDLLPGYSLETVCLLNSEKIKNYFIGEGQNNISVLAYAYLESVKERVNKKITTYQKTMRGAGCFISPKR